MTAPPHLPFQNVWIQKIPGLRDKRITPWKSVFNLGFVKRTDLIQSQVSLSKFGKLQLSYSTTTIFRENSVSFENQKHLRNILEVISWDFQINPVEKCYYSLPKYKS